MDLLSNNLGILDGWTFIHFASGLLVGLLLSNQKTSVLLIWVFVVFGLWEILELRNVGGFGGSENWLNLGSDMVVGLLGAYLGQKMVIRSQDG